MNMAKNNSTQRRRDAKICSPLPLCVSASRFFFLAFFLCLSVRSEILDRIAVSVGTRVITVNDIAREIRVTAFLNGVKPDLDAANRRATAERMVEQKLIQQELEDSRYPVPSASEIDPILADFRKKHFASDAEFQHALTDYGITEQDVKASLLWERTLLEFIEVRFRPGVQVGDQEIQDYFDTVVAPAARVAHPGVPVALEDYRNQIEEKLAGQRVDQQMNGWLESVRKRTEVVFHPEALQ
jgi:peptidyl-prolyl cis-trans isomerase SurA